MELLLVEEPIVSPVDLFQWDPWWLAVIVIAVLFLLLVGYTIGARYFGFGPHDVKWTRTFEYEKDAAKKGAPEEEGTPVRRTITTETQTGRTFWDWLAILTISAVIAGVTVFFTIKQGQQQLSVQDQQTQDEALQAYIDEMSQMILNDQHPLLEAGADSPERLVARVRTLTTLKRFDARHNKIVLSFLRESGLVSSGAPEDRNKHDSIVQLKYSALNNAELVGSNLTGVNLRAAQLRSADLHAATISPGNLSFADLDNANLRGAHLSNASLFFANLNGAKLANANLNGTRLLGADLSGAKLENAENLTKEQINLAGAGDSNTTLPEDIRKPNWWSDPYSKGPELLGGLPVVRDSNLGASLIALEDLKSHNLDDEIGIPKYAGTSKKWSHPGVLVYDVRHDSIADDAGLIPGDVITVVGNDKDTGFNVKNLEDAKKVLDKYTDERQDLIVVWVQRYYFPEGWQKGYRTAHP